MTGALFADVLAELLVAVLRALGAGLAIVDAERARPYE